MWQQRPEKIRVKIYLRIRLGHLNSQLLSVTFLLKRYIVKINKHLTCKAYSLSGKELYHLYIWYEFQCRLELCSPLDLFCIFCPDKHEIQTYFRGQILTFLRDSDVKKPPVKSLLPNPFKIKYVFFKAFPKTPSKPSFLTFSLVTLMFTVQQEKCFKGILKKKSLWEVQEL